VALLNLGQKMKKSTASSKVEWLQMPWSQPKERLPRFTDIEEDNDGLEENK